MSCSSPSNLENESSGDEDEDEDEDDDDEEEEEEDESATIKQEEEEEEDDDLNVMRERELSELKCKSVVEKTNVFVKYYRQFARAYTDRVHTLESSSSAAARCSDALKLQFHSLVKQLADYDALLAQLHAIVVEHERDRACANNHRKTKKLFNKSKTFIRYECSKRLEASIFEYRRLINSQDPYAGMYDLIDMNKHLISMLPDIGVSIRRYYYYYNTLLL